MSDWTEGYVTEIEYTTGFYREMAPANLEWCALLNSYEAPSASKPYNYLEIGCGQGVSAAVLAAANPHARFWAFDFNPLHVRNARELAAAGGLTNIEYFEDSFAEALERDLPQMDFIVLHGVYSWVTAENRGQIVALLKKFLKPGGLAYVSYNCLPGWAGKAPLRKLMTEHAARQRGSILDRFVAAREFVVELKQTECTFFRAHPTAGALVDLINGQKNANYLVHEYLNEAWELLYHSDVVREMHGAKLGYLGSATIAENFDEASAPPALRPMLAKEKDPVMRELLRDFGVNRQFRRDIFARGASRLAGAEVLARIGATRFVLARPRNLCTSKLMLPLGEAQLQENVFVPIMDALAGGPKSAAELAQAAGKPVKDTLFMISVLAGANYILPLLASEPPGKPAQQFNQVMVRRAQQGRELPALAAPRIGSGVGLGAVDQLLLLAMSRKAPDVALFAHERLLTLGRRLTDSENKSIDDNDQHLARMRAIEAKFVGESLPVCRALGVV
jgi:predicted O-methyltransferase YrrM